METTIITTKGGRELRNRGNKGKKSMLEALEKTLGVVTSACKMTGIGRVTHYRWMHSDPVYAARVAELENVALDFVESKLLEKIQGYKVRVLTEHGEELVYSREPDTTAIIFYLKTKGRARGYGQDVHIAPVGDNQQNFFTIDIS